MGCEIRSGAQKVTLGDKYLKVINMIHCFFSQFTMQVHIIRNFRGVKVEKYNKAIKKQSIACPKTNLRRQILNTVLSPSPSAFLSSLAVEPNNFREDLFAEKGDFDAQVNQIFAL